MKRIYWKSNKVLWKVLLTVALIAILGFIGVETSKGYVRAEDYDDKIQAARIMKSGMEVIKEYRIKNIGDKYVGQIGEQNPNLINSGMIGIPFSPITTIVVSPKAKIPTINPNWGAVMIDLYKKAGLKKGDSIAVGFTGSYPALNLATLAAAEVMDIKVIGISGVTASNWGANLPELAWLDMERILNEKQIISNHSIAASPGGVDDLALGISQEGQKIIDDIVDRNQVDFIKYENRSENINKRMEVYYKYAANNQIKAYVNVGGGTISVGKNSKENVFTPGLNKNVLLTSSGFDSLMRRFAKQGLPVIHIRHSKQLAEKFKMPNKLKQIPNPGEGKIYGKEEYNKFVVFAVFITIILVLFALSSTEYVNLIFSVNTEKSPSELPEPMI